jgi:hypothetical protein
MAIPEPKARKFFAVSEVRARGWTATMIERILGEPDQLTDNPHGWGSMMRLYKAERVIQAEATPDFKAFVERGAKRRAAAKAAAPVAVATKVRKALDWVEALGVVLEPEPFKEVERAAIDAYNNNDFHELKSDPFKRRAGVRSDPWFLDRITVNFFRHECTGYDEQLERLFGKVGVWEASRALRAKVLYAIGVAYPRLKRESERQAQRRTPGITPHVHTQGGEH